MCQVFEIKGSAWCTIGRSLGQILHYCVTEHEAINVYNGTCNAHKVTGHEHQGTRDVHQVTCNVLQMACDVPYTL